LNINIKSKKDCILCTFCCTEYNDTLKTINSKHRIFKQILLKTKNEYRLRAIDHEISNDHLTLELHKRGRLQFKIFTGLSVVKQQNEQKGLTRGVSSLGDQVERKYIIIEYNINKNKKGTRQYIYMDDLKTKKEQEAVFLQKIVDFINTDKSIKRKANDVDNTTKKTKIITLK
jgi:hypothetical protein